MLNKKLEIAINEVTNKINEEIKELNHLYYVMNSNELISQYNPLVNSTKTLRTADSQALLLSNKDQLIDFVIGMLNKAAAENNFYHNIFFNGFKSTVNDYTIHEQSYAQLVVEMCSSRKACRPDPLLFTTLAVIVNHYAEYFQGRNAQLIEEAKLVCLIKMLLSIQAKKSELQLAS